MSGRRVKAQRKQTAEAMDSRIDPALRRRMQATARAIDRVYNGDAKGKARTYISNANRLQAGRMLIDQGRKMLAEHDAKAAETGAN